MTTFEVTNIFGLSTCLMGNTGQEHFGLHLESPKKIRKGPMIAGKFDNLCCFGQSLYVRCSWVT